MLRSSTRRIVLNPRRGFNLHKQQAGLVALTRIIHERFCCNRGDGSQNLMWYPLFAPRSCKGRSIDLVSAVATHLDAVGPASRQAGSPLGRSTYCFKYASLPHGSARLSRVATARFRNEPS